MILYVNDSQGVMMQYLLGLSYFILIAIIAVILWSAAKFRSCVKKNNKAIIIFSLSSLLVITIVLFLHLRQEDFIAHWEYGGYWKKTLELKSLMQNDPNSILPFVYDSINTMDYNYLLQLFLQTPLIIIGDSFARYVLCVYIVFLVPFNILLFSFLLMIFDDLKIQNFYLTILSALVIMTFSSNLIPLVLGYIGSGALILILTNIILWYCGVFDKRLSPYAIFTGVSLLLIVLMRRWYAFYVLAFFISYGIQVLWKNRKDIKQAIPGLLNLFVSGIIALGLFFVFFRPLLVTFLTSNHSLDYSVYQYDANIFSLLMGLVKHFGSVYSALVVIGVYYGFKNKQLQPLTLVSLASIVFIIIVFTSIQSFGDHHFYLINIPFLILLILGLLQVFVWLRKTLWQRLFVGAISLLLLVNISSDLFSIDNPIIAFSNTLIARSLPDKINREDIDKVQQVTLFLKNNVGEASVYVLASSPLFSDDILENALLPDELTPIKNLALTKSIDLRDGIPADFFSYQYIVVADPIQVQFSQADSQNIVILANQFIDQDSSLHQFYTKLESYDIGYGITVSIYRREAEVPSEVKQEISDLFREVYPDNPELYEFN